MSVIEKFAEVDVLCIGDVVVDNFIDGEVKRISSESPVPVLLASHSRLYPGGAANAARNIAALGGRCILIGVTGDDERGRLLAADLEAGGIRTSFVVSRSRPTTEKNRFMAQGQQMLRVDWENSTPIAPEEGKALLAKAAALISGCAVMVLSDYGNGVLTDEVIRGAVALARERGIPVVVDPRSRNLARYRGATVVKPNTKEIEAATGIETTTNEGAAAAAARAMELAECDAILLTRAEKGMTLVRRDSPPVHIPSRAREVFDVAGAGDTVIAALALTLGGGGDLEEAARIANAAAGIVVGRSGTATVSQSDLLEELTGAGAMGVGSLAAKILDWDQLEARVKVWRRDGLCVGFTNGCFDLLHLGHIRLMQFARANCDRLIVGVNGDASVTRLKGAERPLNPVEDRAEVLAALGTVDAVTVFGEDTPYQLIERIQPDLLVKGADYTVEQMIGSDIVLKRGGKALRFDLVPGRSSTGLTQKLKKTT
jgi:D-beta-D-heptose 7-phosphate kinase / D-beta-D-heptose 1-phosphate adenosyltransferase